MFSFLQNKPKEERTMCVLVVNSYSVIASVVRTYHREDAVAKPVVLFSCEEKIPHHRFGSLSLQERRKAEVFGERFAEEIKKVLEKCRMVHGNYDKIVCVVGEPWVMTKTRDINIEKPAGFKITQKMIDEAILRDSRLFEQEALRDYAKNEEWGIMHSSKPLVDVNGYRTEKPVGIIAKTAVIHVAVSLAPASFLEMIIGAYADVFHRADISFIGTEGILSDFVKHQGGSAIVTLGGVSSTLSLFTQGVLSHSEKIKNGLVEFEDTVAYLFGVNHAHIASVMKFASDEKLLEHERDVYYKRIEVAYKNLSNEIRLAMLHAKKQTGGIAGPVTLLASPAWIAILRPLLEKDIEVGVVVPQMEVFNNEIVYTHDARVKNVILSLAILAALDK